METIYYAEPGPQNTDTTLSRAREHAVSQEVQHVVIASDTGKTAKRALEVFGHDHTIVVVTNPPNLRLPVAKLHDYLSRFERHKQSLIDQGVQHVPCSLAEDTIAELRQAGATVTRIDWRKLQAFTRVGLQAVDRIGVGVRVALTTTLWACASNALPPDRDVISIAGTGFGGGGADTAIVVRTAKRFKDFRVLETLCKPRVSPPSELPG